MPPPVEIKTRHRPPDDMARRAEGAAGAIPGDAEMVGSVDLGGGGGGNGERTRRERSQNGGVLPSGEVGREQDKRGEEPEIQLGDIRRPFDAREWRTPGQMMFALGRTVEAANGAAVDVAMSLPEVSDSINAITIFHAIQAMGRDAHLGQIVYDGPDGLVVWRIPGDEQHRGQTGHTLTEEALNKLKRGEVVSTLRESDYADYAPPLPKEDEGAPQRQVSTGPREPFDPDFDSSTGVASSRPGASSEPVQTSTTATQLVTGEPARADDLAAEAGSGSGGGGTPPPVDSRPAGEPDELIDEDGSVLPRVDLARVENERDVAIMRMREVLGGLREDRWIPHGMESLIVRAGQLQQIPDDPEVNNLRRDVVQALVVSSPEVRASLAGFIETDFRSLGRGDGGALFLAESLHNADGFLDLANLYPEAHSYFGALGTIVRERSVNPQRVITQTDREIFESGAEVLRGTVNELRHEAQTAREVDQGVRGTEESVGVGESLTPEQRAYVDGFREILTELGGEATPETVTEVMRRMERRRRAGDEEHANRVDGVFRDQDRTARVIAAYMQRPDSGLPLSGEMLSLLGPEMSGLVIDRLPEEQRLEAQRRLDAYRAREAASAPTESEREEERPRTVADFQRILTPDARQVNEDGSMQPVGLEAAWRVADGPDVDRLRENHRVADDIAGAIIAENADPTDIPILRGLGAGYLHMVRTNLMRRLYQGEGSPLLRGRWEQWFDEVDTPPAARVSDSSGSTGSDALPPVMRPAVPPQPVAEPDEVESEPVGPAGAVTPQLAPVVPGVVNRDSSARELASEIGRGVARVPQGIVDITREAGRRLARRGKGRQASQDVPAPSAADRTADELETERILNQDRATEGGDPGEAETGGEVTRRELVSQLNNFVETIGSDGFSRTDALAILNRSMMTISRGGMTDEERNGVAARIKDALDSSPDSSPRLMLNSAFLNAVRAADLNNQDPIRKAEAIGGWIKAVEMLDLDKNIAGLDETLRELKEALNITD